ncbi:MAG: hypothetical protein CSB06_03730 [Bacteroidia bacterium]|nr:MAG: hypothetical protein CSB06_03730 [Bacteroidia bacterium]
MKTAVVILNWNGIKYLQEYLPAVVEHTPEDASIYLADNGSTDESVAFVKDRYPRIQLILLDKNYLFAGGYNRALAQIEADYYVLLNSDAEVTPNWLHAPIEAMEKDRTIAATMPKILSYEEKEYYEYAGASGGFIDKYGYPFCRGRILDAIEKDEGQYDQPLEIFWASGAAFFVRADLYHKFGGFDEQFGAHMEEIDLCWRFKNQNYSIKIIPESKIYHLGGGTLPVNTPKKIFLNYRNNLFTLLKNLPRKTLFKTLFIRMILDGLSAGTYILQGKFKFVGAVIKAHCHFYKNFSAMYAKRSPNIPQKHPEIYPRSIIYRFFIKKERKWSSLTP